MRAHLLVGVVCSGCGFSISSSSSVDDGPPIDVAPVVPSRVWVIGDWVATGKTIAGAFRDGAMLPFGNGTPPPVVVPGGTSLLPSDPGYTPMVFDATPDGGKVAFVSDLAVSDRFDLYVANRDGGSPTMIVQGRPNIEIGTIKVSPDGSKLAYTSDSVATNQAYDLYVVSTTMGATPRKLSPNRGGGLAALQQVLTFTWSADSRYLAFSADINADDVFQAYCADTTTTNPGVELLSQADIAAQTSGIRGVRGALELDAANNVYFVARTVANDPRFQLFRIQPDGQQKADLTSQLPRRPDSSLPGVGAIGITPDGTRLIIAADSAAIGRYDLHDHLIGSTATTRFSSLTSAWVPADARMRFSPSANRVAILGSVGTAVEPFVFALDGSDTHRAINLTQSCSGCPDPNTRQLEWTADGSALYAVGDLTTNNLSKLYRLNPAMTDQVPVIAADAPSVNLGGVIYAVVRPE